jgi:hypothetical protein
MGRRFTSGPATRVRVPLWLALCGPSGAGKTLSALRLAAGIQRVDPGPIAGVDTESGRMNHYAPRPGEKADGRYTFDFIHVPFEPPYSPADYVSVLEYCASLGVRTAIVDSGSHLHEGEGGLLEMHDSLTQQLAAKWNCSHEKASTSAWITPKKEEWKFLSAAKRMQMNLIVCLRAKDKTDFKGPKPKAMGYMPIISNLILFEMTMSCLLLPGTEGTPTWHPAEMGERAIVKLPGYLRDFFKEKKQLDEATGEALARWAAGGTTAASAGASSPPTSPTEGAKSAATETSAASPKASAGQLEALATQLGANGLSTKDARREWFWKLTGKTLSDATADDVQRAIEQAEVEAA